MENMETNQSYVIMDILSYYQYDGQNVIPY